MFSRALSYYGRYKLRIQLILINGMIVLTIIVVMGAIAAFHNYNSTKKSVSNSVDLLFNQVNGRLVEFLESVDLVSGAVFLNNDFQKMVLLEAGESDGYNRYLNVRNYMNGYRELNHSIKGFVFVDSSGNRYVSSFSVPSELTAFLDANERDGFGDGSMMLLPLFLREDRVSSVYLGIREVRSILDMKYMQKIGVGFVVLDRNKLDSLIDDKFLKPGSEVLIVGDGRRVISSTDKASVGNRIDESVSTEEQRDQFVTIDRTRYMVKTSRLSQTGLTLVAKIPTDELFKEARTIAYSLLFAIPIPIVLAILINLYFNILITKPLKKLTDAFRRFASGDMTIQIRYSDNNELTGIARQFNKMVGEIHELSRRNLATQQQLYESELAKKQFELDGLHSQINSHFLYNTLNSMVGMALTDSKQEIIRTVENLGNFFRYSVNVNDFVEIVDELKHLDTYLDIQKLRFPRKFRYLSEIEPALLHHRMLKLVLQPLIENALFHGLEHKQGKGLLKIKMFSSGDDMILQVFDNGMGMDLQTLSRLNASLLSGDEESDTRDKDRRGVGLINIQRRIRLHYGDGYGIRAKSWENIGTVVSVAIPKMEEEGSECIRY
ncbi:sensor histidine kinase [Cohnella sp. LGH]|uniref:sensor histidine kinase n=1 Tax=Cohnella sp. LGH TaxID=1619153 RepID=UPI001ADCBD85|nr:histidine kinase [Cohnella sp. LGH]QTH40121.1 sensor histidine kinase [Cohnella sp. LGH]